MSAMKPKSMTAFCVVDNRGHGHPKAIATSAFDAKWNYVSHLYGIGPVDDVDEWWRENAKNHHVRVVKVTISTTNRFKAERWSGWLAGYPSEERCEIDNGWLNVKQCENRSKHEWNGRRVCTSHKKMLEAGKEFGWIDSPTKKDRVTK